MGHNSDEDASCATCPHKARIDEMWKQLFGNGESIPSRLARVEERLDTLETQLSENTKAVDGMKEIVDKAAGAREESDRMNTRQGNRIQGFQALIALALLLMGVFQYVHSQHDDSVTKAINQLEQQVQQVQQTQQQPQTETRRDRK